MESIVLVRDHLGACYDSTTMTTLEWRFCEEEPTEPIKDMVTTNCMMPSCDRWHCTLTEEERTHGTGLRIYAGRPYKPVWASNKACLRQTEDMPPQKALNKVSGLVARLSPLPPWYHSVIRKENENHENGD